MACGDASDCSRSINSSTRVLLLRLTHAPCRHALVHSCLPAYPQAHVLEQEVSTIVFGGAPPQLNGAGGGGGGVGGSGGGGGGEPFGACRDCGAQLQLVMSADGSPPSILCSAFPMHRLRIDLPRCTISVAVTGEWCGGGGRPGKR